MMKLIFIILATILVLLQRTDGFPARTVNIRKGVRTVLKSGSDVKALYNQHTRVGRGKPGAPWRQGELDLPPTTARAIPTTTTRGWVSVGPGEGGPEELKYYISLHEKPYVIV